MNESLNTLKNSKEIRKLKINSIWKLYTYSFLFIMIIFNLILWATNKSLIWDVDGINQHYPILINFHQMLQNFVSNPKSGLTNWSWNIGLGADQLTSYSYYVIGDLFNYLIIFFPTSKIELGFNLLIWLRIYCAGLTFILYSNQFQFKKISILVGCLTYTFSSYAIYVSMHHPFFLLPLILFPLLCYGINQIIIGKQWLPFSLAIALTYISNFYFAYILTLGSIIYFIIEYLILKNKNKYKLGFTIIKLIKAICTGIITASIILIPTILYVIHSTRINSDFANGYLFYPLKYYLTIPLNLISNDTPINFWLLLNLSSISLLSIIYTFSHFKKYLNINIFLLIALIGIVFPAFSAIFNAFAAPSNRWIVLILLPIGIATIILMDNLTNITKKELIYLSISSLIILSLSWFATLFQKGNNLYYLIGYIFLLILIIILLVGNTFKENYTLIKSEVIVLVFINIISIGLGYYLPKNQVNSTLLYREDANTYISNYYNNANNYIKDDMNEIRTNQGPYYKFQNSSTNYSNNTSNIPIILKTHNISSYLTVQNAYIGNFFSNVWNNQFTYNTPINQMDYRTTLNNLMGVKYMFIHPNQIKQSLPYGFKPILNSHHKILVFPDDNESSQTVILKNDNALPLLYTQDHKITQKQFYKLPPTSKEQVLIRAAEVNQNIKNISTLNNLPKPDYLQYTNTIEDNNILNLPLNSSKMHNQLLKKTINKYNSSPTTYNKQINNINNLTTKNNQLIIDNKNINNTSLKELNNDVLGKSFNYTLSIKHPEQTKNKELYLEINKINSVPFTPQELTNYKTNRMLVNGSVITPFIYFRTNLNNIINSTNNGYTVNIKSKGMKNGFNQYSTDNLSFYFNRKHALVNLGYSKHMRKNIFINFKGANQVNFKNARIIAVPFNKQYQNNIKKDQRNKVNNLNFYNNKINGKVNLSNSQILVTSIPFSTGWHLKIDNKDVPTYRVNEGFVGATLPKGNHKLSLQYQTPGLKIGITLTIIGLSILLISSISIIFIQNKIKAKK